MIDELGDAVKESIGRQRTAKIGSGRTELQRDWPADIRLNWVVQDQIDKQNPSTAFRWSMSGARA
jgi:hypothetical protein